MAIEIPFNAASANAAIDALTRLNRKLKTTEDRLKAVQQAYSTVDSSIGSIADLASAVSGPSRSPRRKSDDGDDSTSGSQSPPKQPKSPFEQWVSTMRFGNGKLSPLVGRTGAMVGSALGLGPAAVTSLTTGLGIAAAALQAFISALGAASAASLAYRDVWFSGGPGVGGALRAGSMFEGGIGNRAMAFQQAIQSGGAASAFAQNAGINIVGGPFGDINYTQKYQKALANLAKMSPVDARRVAMAYGQPDMADIALLSPANQRVALDQSTKDDNMRGMADLSFSINEVKRLAQELFRDTLVPAMSSMLESAREFLDTIIFIKDIIKAVGDLPFVQEALRFVQRTLNPVGNMVGDMKSKYEELKTQMDHKAAIDANTDATNELSRAMRENTNERLGGGDRTQGAVPKDIPGWVLDDAEARKSIRTGMF